MFIALTRGFFQHSEPAGSGAPVLVRISDIERIEQAPTEQWVGESGHRHVGSRVWLTSMRDYRGQHPYDGSPGGLLVRETMDKITTSLAAAIPAHQEIHDHAMHGAVRIAVDNRVDHRVAVTGMVEHVGLPMPADV